MDTREAALVRMLDARARRLEREAREVRRIVAQLRDTVTDPDTPEVEETATHGD